MFSRWRLPPDNFADDTQSSAFQNYREPTPNPARSFWRQRRVWGALTLIFLLGVLSGTFLLSLLRNDGESARVSGSEPAATVNTTSSAAFDEKFPAPAANRLFVTLPARVSNLLTPAAPDGFLFYARDNFIARTWRIRIYSDFAPRITLYNAAGDLFTESSLVRTSAWEVSFSLEQTGIYAILVESTDPLVAGAYTISILPVE